MIGLPDGVGAGRLVAMDQVEGIGRGLRPFMEGPQGRVQGADQVIDGVVARRRLPELLGEGDGMAMDGRRRQRGGFFRARPSMAWRSVSERRLMIGMEAEHGVVRLAGPLLMPGQPLQGAGDHLLAPTVEELAVEVAEIWCRADQLAIVAAVRSGRSQHEVAQEFHVGQSVVHHRVHHAHGQRLDRVDWHDRPHTTRTPSRTDPAIEVWS